MTFKVIGLRTADDAEHGSALYPVLSDQSSPYPIEFEVDDSASVLRVKATGVTVSERPPGSQTIQRLGGISDVDIDVYISDCRVALACEKYEKGGGWRGFGVGGLVVAGAANAVSHARAANRRRGKVLVGHVRYPWLANIGVRTRAGAGTSNGLRLLIKERSGAGASTIFIDLTLAKQTDAPHFAQQIAVRCAAYRLARDISPDNEHRAAFETLANAAKLSPPPKTYAFYDIPHHWYVSPKSAHLERPDSSLTPEGTTP